MQVHLTKQSNGLFAIYSNLIGDTLLDNLSEGQALLEMECWVGFTEAHRLLQQCRSLRQSLKSKREKVPV